MMREDHTGLHRILEMPQDQTPRNEVSKGTYRFVCLAILIIVGIGVVLFIRMVWIGEQDPISSPSWDAERRSREVSNLQARVRAYQATIPPLRATIAQMPLQREMLDRVRQADARTSRIPEGRLSDAQIDKVAGQIADAILAEVNATTVAGWHTRGTRVVVSATAAARDLSRYRDAVDNYEKESEARRHVWYWCAAVVGGVLILFAIAVVRGRQRGREEARNAKKI